MRRELVRLPLRTLLGLLGRLPLLLGCLLPFRVLAPQAAALHPPWGRDQCRAGLSLFRCGCIRLRPGLTSPNLPAQSLTAGEE
jgi:hypothetical protein